MKYTLLSLGFLFSGAAGAAIECTITYKELVPNQQALIEKANMTVTADLPNMMRLEGELRGRSFILSGTPQDGRFLLSQVWGADYTNGVNSSATFNSDGRFALSTVSDLPRKDGNYTGSAVHRVECVKK